MFAFSQQTYNVGEGDIIAEVCVNLIGGVTSVNIPVTITTADGSANRNNEALINTYSMNYLNVYTHRARRLHLYNTNCELSLRVLTSCSDVHRHSHHR